MTARTPIARPGCARAPLKVDSRQRTCELPPTLVSQRLGRRLIGDWLRRNWCESHAFSLPVLHYCVPGHSEPVLYSPSVMISEYGSCACVSFLPLACRPCAPCQALEKEREIDQVLAQRTLEAARAQARVEQEAIRRFDVENRRVTAAQQHFDQAISTGALLSGTGLSGVQRFPDSEARALQEQKFNQEDLPAYRREWAKCIARKEEARTQEREAAAALAAREVTQGTFFQPSEVTLKAAAARKVMHCPFTPEASFPSQHALAYVHSSASVSLTPRMSHLPWARVDGGRPRTSSSSSVGTSETPTISARSKLKHSAYRPSHRRSWRG